MSKDNVVAFQSPERIEDPVNTEAVCPHFTDSRCPVLNDFLLG